jgi:hypothetical protein
MKGKGGEWSFDELNKFLAAPQGYIPGTTMGFAGLPRGSERADVIDYLRTRADNPMPLPKVAEAPAGAPAAGQPRAAQGQPGTAPAAPQPGNAGAQGNAPPGKAPPPQ